MPVARGSADTSLRPCPLLRGAFDGDGSAAGERLVDDAVALGQREAPVGFRAIRLIFDLDNSASEKQLEKLLSLTERYCVVYQTLTGGVAVSIDHSP